MAEHGQIASSRTWWTGAGRRFAVLPIALLAGMLAGSSLLGGCRGTGGSGSGGSSGGGGKLLSYDDFQTKTRAWTNGELPEQKGLAEDADHKKQLFFRIFGEPKRKDAVGDHLYFYYDTRDGVVQLVASKVGYDGQGDVYIDDCNLYGK